MKGTNHKSEQCGRDAHTTKSRRSGMALLIVMVALAIVSAIGMSLLRMSLMHHRQAQRAVFAAQARWLAESAFDQTGRRLKADAKLEGFTWSVLAAELDGHHAGRVTIQVKPVENAPQRREVTINADFPASGPRRSNSRIVRFVDL